MTPTLPADGALSRQEKPSQINGLHQILPPDNPLLRQETPSTHPTEAEFRAAGFTIDAANYPLSERAFVWLCEFNGVAPEAAPQTWRYAPNPHMQAWLDEKAR